MMRLTRPSCHCCGQTRWQIDALGGSMSPLDKPTRREFLVTTSSAALGAAVPLASSQPDSPATDAPATPISEALPYSSEELFPSGPPPTFTGDRPPQTSMPLPALI